MEQTAQTLTSSLCWVSLFYKYIQYIFWLVLNTRRSPQTSLTPSDCQARDCHAQGSTNITLVLTAIICGRYLPSPFKFFAAFKVGVSLSHFVLTSGEKQYKSLLPLLSPKTSANFGPLAQLPKFSLGNVDVEELGLRSLAPGTLAWFLPGHVKPCTLVRMHGLLEKNSQLIFSFLVLLATMPKFGLACQRNQGLLPTLLTSHRV